MELLRSTYSDPSCGRMDTEIKGWLDQDLRELPEVHLLYCCKAEHGDELVHRGQPDCTSQPHAPRSIRLRGCCSPEASEMNPWPGLDRLHSLTLFALLEN